MAQFTWTAPDPLTPGQTTRSIYITELQDAANVKRAEISQSPISFIDQSVGQPMRLSAIEELKTVVNQLALDFGYTDGVKNDAILGRDYVDHPIVLGKPAAGFPIINDLRKALNLIVAQVDFLLIPITGFFTTGGHSKAQEIDPTNTFIDVDEVNLYSSSGLTGSAVLPTHPIDTLGNYVQVAFFGGPLRIRTIITGFNATANVQEDTNYSVSSDVCSDTDYIYVTCRRNSDFNFVLVKYDKNSRATGDALDELDNLPGGSGTSLVNDADNLFIGGSELIETHADGFTVEREQAKLVRVSKPSLNLSETLLFDLDLVKSVDLGALDSRFIAITKRLLATGTLTIDNDHIYGFYEEEVISFRDSTPSSPTPYIGVKITAPIGPSNGDTYFVPGPGLGGFTNSSPAFQQWTGSSWITIGQVESRTSSATALVIYNGKSLGGAPSILKSTVLLATSNSTIFSGDPDNFLIKGAGMAAQGDKLYIVGESDSSFTLRVRDKTSGNLVEEFNQIGRVGVGEGVRTVYPGTGSNSYNYIASLDEFNAAIA